MSYFKTNNIIGKFELEGFSGIDRSSCASGNTCTDMVNLRVLPDRSVVKRDGFCELFDFTDDVRGVLTGKFDGKFVAFVVAGDLVYKFDFESKTCKGIGVVKSETGPVSIFCYMGRVYIMDGMTISEIRDDVIYTTSGYAPLVGKDWGSNYPGEIYEPRNILTPKARISYIVDDPPTAFLATQYAVASVDAVYVNGVRKAKDTYGIDSRLRLLNVSGLNAGDKVLVYYNFTYSSEERDRFTKNTSVRVFGGTDNNRVFVWGGDEKNRIFVSTPTSPDSIKEAEVVLKNCGGLYFAENNDFAVGDSDSEIREVIRHYDRLLMFTDKETWTTDTDPSPSGEYPMTRVNTELGCSALSGVVKSGNDPISVGRGDIYRWTSNTDSLEDRNAYAISYKIKDILPTSFFSDAVVFADRHNGEILFSYPDGDRRRVLVYAPATEDWYIYDNVSADLFFEGESSLGFASGSKLCIFERGASKDSFLDHTERQIDAFCVYAPHSFGHPTRKKRIAGVMGVGELKGGELNVSFESDSGNIYAVDLAGGDTGCVEFLYKRGRSERFKSSRIKISTDASVQQRLYSLTVAARA